KATDIYAVGVDVIAHYVDRHGPRRMRISAGWRSSHADTHSLQGASVLKQVVLVVADLQNKVGEVRPHCRNLGMIVVHHVAIGDDEVLNCLRKGMAAVDAVLSKRRSDLNPFSWGRRDRCLITTGECKIGGGGECGRCQGLAGTIDEGRRRCGRDGWDTDTFLRRAPESGWLWNDEFEH